MRDDDPRADNLLLRLGSYTPRVGRDALEDFCTEILAWCLRGSQIRRRKFLDCLGLQEMDAVSDPESVMISTQVAWSETEHEDENGPANGNDKTIGRFDLVLIHTRREFVVVVESKRRAEIEKEQVGKYLKELNRSDRFTGVPLKRRYLVGLTNYQGEIDGLNGRVSWSSLVDKVLDEHDDLQDGNRLVVGQFKDFLKEKGLGPMKLEKVVGSGLLMAWRDIRTIQEQLGKILMAVRDDEELEGKLRLKSHADLEGLDWYGVRSSGPYFYVGFRFLDDKQNTKMYLFIERSLLGDHRSKVKTLSENLSAAANEARKFGDWPELNEKGETFFGFAKEVDGQLDGNPQAIVRWFVDTSKEVLALNEHEPNSAVGSRTDVASIG